MPRDIKGNVAVITGGGSPHGIGAATGRLLAEQGCRVVLSDINPDTLNATVEAFVSEGLDVIGVVSDVANLESMQNLADTVFDRYGKVDIVFLNAGISPLTNYFDGDDLKTWDHVFGINFFGVLYGIKAFGNRMIEQKTPGNIIGTTSGAGAVGVMYETPAYATSKAAMLTLLEGLYGKLRDLDSPVRVHAVFPPLTRTNLGGNPEVMPMVQQGLQSSGVASILAEPEEVAMTVLEAILSGNFWAHHEHEADKRLYDGKFAEEIEWQDMIIRERADAIINRTAPDPYLWGKFPS